MARVRTANQVLVREINLSIIRNALRELSPCSRAALAAATGLNKTTVSSLVRQLMDARFISEVGAHQTKDTGRPGILLALNPKAGCMIGVEIGVDFISVILTNFAVEIVWRRYNQTNPHDGQPSIIQRTLQLIRTAVKQSTKHAERILGLGLGVARLGGCGLGHVALRAELALARRAVTGHPRIQI